MVGSRVRFAAAATFLLLLNACASAPDSRVALDYQQGPRNGARIETPKTPLQCVPYARQRSGIALFGDAGTWWDQAAGRFARNTSPSWAPSWFSPVMPARAAAMSPS